MYYLNMPAKSYDFRCNHFDTVTEGTEVFIQRCGWKQAWVKHWQTGINGKTKSIPRTSVGLRSANSIQQGKAKRDNPGNVKQQ